MRLKLGDMCMRQRPRVVGPIMYHKGLRSTGRSENTRSRAQGVSTPQSHLYFQTINAQGVSVRSELTPCIYYIIYINSNIQYVEQYMLTVSTQYICATRMVVLWDWLTSWIPDMQTGTLALMRRVSLSLDKCHVLLWPASWSTLDSSPMLQEPC